MTHALPPLAPPTVLDAPLTAFVVAAPATSSAREADQCANCLAPLTGDFCANCGAPRLERRPLTVRRFAGDLWNEVTNVDSASMRTVRTLILAPGRLTSEYLAGRTRWYLSPLRVFLLMTAISLLVRAQLGINERMEEAARQRMHQGAPAAKATTGAKAPASQATALGKAVQRRTTSVSRRRAERQMDSLHDSIPTEMVALSANQWVRLLDPFVMAVALMLIFRRKRRNYAEHVVHAMHLLAFAAVMAAVILPLSVANGTELQFWTLPTALNGIVLWRYAYRSAREVHRDGVARAVFDSTLMLAATQAATIISFTVALTSVLFWRLGWIVAGSLR